MTDPLADRWKQCKEIIQHRLKEEDAAAWLPALELTSLSPSKAVLSGIANPFFRNRIGHQFAPLLRECLAESFVQTRFDEDFQLELCVGSGAGRQADPEGAGGMIAAGDADGLAPANLLAADETGHNPFSGPEDRYTFHTLVEGPCNRLALQLAREVAAKPGKRHNPLFIVGGIGLGKTHLLRAIAHQTRRAHPLFKVIYRTAEEFTNDVVDGIRRKRMKAFREKYRGADLLLLDSVEFLSVSVKAQEELLHTFDALHAAEAQLVFSSTRFPAALDGLDPALRSRFEPGLVTELSEPDDALRLRMLQAKAAMEQVMLPENVARLLIERISSGFRRLEGALVRLIAYASMLNEPITVNFAARVAEPFFDPAPPEAAGLPVTADAVLGAVCDQYGITVKALRSRNRMKTLVEARRVAMYLLREAGGLSYPEIGAALGSRTYSTVQQALGKVERDLMTNIGFKNALSGLREELKSRN
ncbi:MAG: chromosomal replication initiator protein DnaA [SAR324 cluster bacterium]|nr:chromosomal replication initiator protein DnaA [SAR324 cluster bacterium]